MNPILASTLEFDSYVKQKLLASRAASGRSAKKEPNSNEAVSRLSIGGKSISSSQIRPKSGVKSSHEHGNRYHTMGSEFTSSSDAKYRKTSNRVPDPAPSPPTFEIAHSWKAHIRPVDRTIPVTIPRLDHNLPLGDECVPPPPVLPYRSTGSTSVASKPKSYERRYDSKYDDDICDDPDYMSAPPFIEVLSDAFSSKMAIASSSPATYSVSQDFAQHYAIKIRIFRLKKLFRAWRAISLRSKPLYQRMEQSIANLRREYTIISYFDEWKWTWLALSFYQVVSF